MAQEYLKATIVTKGTAVQISTGGVATKFAVIANPNNTETIWIGSSLVSSTGAVGYPLQPGDSHIFDESEYLTTKQCLPTPLSAYYIDGYAGDILHGEYRL